MATEAHHGEACALCGRRGPPLTKHHLIPRAMHNRKWARRRFGREGMQAGVIWVCEPCHRHIHATLSEKQLAHEYNTCEALLAHPEIARFVAWIADKPADLAVRSRERRH
ncbi:hypothetical protein [Thiohalorhabdus sp.]|uniref:hypothetical protein n=1 Tax=Thiohalorhabdus sp. TaxID=3094134 RepID=UPI002FC29871